MTNRPPMGLREWELVMRPNGERELSVKPETFREWARERWKSQTPSWRSDVAEDAAERGLLPDDILLEMFGQAATAEGWRLLSCGSERPIRDSNPCRRRERAVS